MKSSVEYLTIAKRFSPLEVSAEYARRSLRGYLRTVVIDSRPPLPFADIAEPWQWDIIEPVIPAIEAVCGVRENYDGPRSFWFTLPRGSDKTSSIGRICNWALLAAKRPISAVAAAGTKDQASLLRQVMKKEANLNEWLSCVEHHNYQVRGPGGQLEIISADAYSSFGHLCDIFVLDELTHWRNRDLFDALFSGRGKRPGAVFIIISNAGFRKTWQYEVLEAAKADQNWHVYETKKGFRPGWINAEQRENDRKLLAPSVARRVFDNEWIDPRSDEAEWPAECFGPEIWFDDWPTDLKIKTMAIDPSKGKNSKHGDYSAIVMLGCCSDGTLWCEADLARRTTDRIVEDGIEWYLRFKPDAMVIEANGFQELLGNDFRRAEKERKLFLNIDLDVNMLKKETRIRKLTSCLTMKRIRFKANSKGTELLVQQLRDFPHSDHDDGPDSLEMAVRLMVKYLNGNRGNAIRNDISTMLVTS